MENLIYSKNPKRGYNSDFEGNAIENHVNGNVDRLHEGNPTWIESKTVSLIIFLPNSAFFNV